jgi:hypothetical protein
LQAGRKPKPAARKVNELLVSEMHHQGWMAVAEHMKAEIILKYEEKERLLQSIPENSPARYILTSARFDSRQPELVAMICDEEAASELLQVAEQHCGSAWRAINCQVKRLGMLRLSLI